jgi:hypothetical protein
VLEDVPKDVLLPICTNGFGLTSVSPSEPCAITTGEDDFIGIKLPDDTTSS